VVQRLIERGKLGGGAAHRGGTPVREGQCQRLVELLQSVGVLLDLPEGERGRPVRAGAGGCKWGKIGRR
jgi:hypothetical protein